MIRSKQVPFLVPVVIQVVYIGTRCLKGETGGDKCQMGVVAYQVVLFIKTNTGPRLIKMQPNCISFSNKSVNVKLEYFIVLS